MPLPKIEIAPAGDRWEVRRGGTVVASCLTPIGAVTLAQGEIEDAANESISVALGSFLALRDRVVRLLGPVAASVNPEEIKSGVATVSVPVPLLDSVILEVNRSGPWTRAIGRVVKTGASVSGSCCSEHGELREAIDSFLALDRCEIARARRAEFARSIEEESRACQASCDTPPATKNDPPSTTESKS